MMVLNGSHVNFLPYFWLILPLFWPSARIFTNIRPYLDRETEYFLKAVTLSYQYLNALFRYIVDTELNNFFTEMSAKRNW